MLPIIGGAVAVVLFIICVSIDAALEERKAKKRRKLARRRALRELHRMPKMPTTPPSEHEPDGM